MKNITEVIRCKNCGYFIPYPTSDNQHHGYCSYYDYAHDIILAIDEEDFCSHAVPDSKGE